MRSLRLALTALLALVAASAAWADEVTVELAWTPGRVGTARSMTLPLKPDPPADLVPPVGLVDARFARIRWGEGRGLGVALDVAPGRERLFFDTDLDGALDDEEEHAWFGEGTAGQRMVGVRVEYADADGVPLELEIRLARAAGWPVDRVQILPQVHRRGEVVLGGRSRAVALVDDNADLRFDDPDRDYAMVDLDGDGRLDASGRERITIGRPFALADGAWRILVEGPSGRHVRFVPADADEAAVPSRWPRTSPPQAGQAPPPPAEPLAQLKQRLEEERHEASGKRLDTIRKLGRTGEDEARDLLLALARKDGDVPVRAAAVRALGHPAWLEAVGDELVAWCRSGQPTVAQAALEALHTAGHPAREAVYREVLASSSAAAVIGAAARHLAYTGSLPARDAVLRAFAAVSDLPTRYQIYLAMRTLEDGPPDAVMLAAAKSDHAPLRAQALRDLATVGHEQLHALALEAAAVRPMVETLALALADVLGVRGDAASVRALLTLAPEASGRMEQRLVERLGALRGGDGLHVLKEALDADDARVRRLAAEILGRVPLPDVAVALRARLARQAKKDVDTTVALLAALGRHADPDSVDVLLRHAKSGKGDVHQAAVRALAAVGLADERVRSYFATLLVARAWEDRVLALDAVGGAAGAALLDDVAKNLRHARWQVRLAAVEALGRVRVKEAIPPLIDHLGREEEARVRDAAAAALYGLTGTNLYDDADLWTRWWAEHGEAFAVPVHVDPLPPRHGGGTTAGFYGIPLRSDRIVFVLDQSGSMSASFTFETPSGTVVGTRLDVASRELIEAVRGLDDKARVNVILFHTTVHPWRDRLQKLSDRNRKDLAKHLHEQKPTGGTNIFDALAVALEDPDVKTIFLLSDGAPGAGRWVQEEDILREVRRLNQLRRTAIHTIAVGMDSSLMRRLAEENDGVYIQVQ